MKKGAGGSQRRSKENAENQPFADAWKRNQETRRAKVVSDGEEWPGRKCRLSKIRSSTPDSTSSSLESSPMLSSNLSLSSVSSVESSPTFSSNLSLSSVSSSPDSSPVVSPKRYWDSGAPSMISYPEKDASSKSFWSNPSPFGSPPTNSARFSPRIVQDENTPPKDVLQGTAHLDLIPQPFMRRKRAAFDLLHEEVYDCSVDLLFAPEVFDQPYHLSTSELDSESPRNHDSVPHKELDEIYRPASPSTQSSFGPIARPVKSADEVECSFCKLFSVPEVVFIPADGNLSRLLEGDEGCINRYADAAQAIWRQQQGLVHPKPVKGYEQVSVDIFVNWAKKKETEIRKFEFEEQLSLEL